MPPPFPPGANKHRFARLPTVAAAPIARAIALDRKTSVHGVGWALPLRASWPCEDWARTARLIHLLPPTVPANRSAVGGLMHGHGSPSYTHRRIRKPAIDVARGGMLLGGKLKAAMRGATRRVNNDFASR